MSELVTRLRRRAHLPEFKICGEAADALEAEVDPDFGTGGLIGGGLAPS